MKAYYRLMLGKASVHAAEGFAGNFVGTDFGIKQNLEAELPDSWRAFNRKFIPVFLAGRPDKSKVAAGLACGAIWTISKGLATGDLVLCPDGLGSYRVGEIAGPYYYQPGDVLPHRRPVHWLSARIDRSDMTDALKNSTGAIGTVSNITAYAEEIERLINGGAQLPIPTDEIVEDFAAFAMERHLEEFLIENWSQTALGKDYDIYEVDGERVGQQYPTDTGPMDILAISKDHKTLLVVELKKGRASDAVVGQTLRYMGYVLEELAEPTQVVQGVIIALEDDQRIRRALSVMSAIEFFKYEITFKLVRA